MAIMTNTRRISANLPDDIPKGAMQITRKGITGTLIQGPQAGAAIRTVPGI
jgi:hypothetical protein